MPGPEIILVVGLPGSGKSFVSSQIARSVGIEDRSPDDDDFLRANLRPPFGLDGVIGRLRAGRSCVVNDISLCDGKRRVEVAAWIEAEAPSVTIRWHYFDNDAVQCAINVFLDAMVGTRGDSTARIGAIRRFSAIYRPPLTQTHPVWGKLPALDRGEFTTDRC